MVPVPDWIKSSLSVEQRQPLTRTSNASLLAAAGSGKTRTLVQLFLADLFKGIPPSAMVAFTFTEKAAEELTARIYSAAERSSPAVDPTGIYVGTIHAWCFEYLLDQSDFYNFTPIDELHLDSLVSRLYDDLKLEKAYAQTYPRAIGSFLSDLEIFYNEHLEFQDVPQGIRGQIADFLDILQENRLLTFGGMVRHATEHLKSSGSPLNLDSLYVDEYQDVNPAQVALIKAMVPNNSKILVVGDDLQCIYNWRGSDVARILNFPSEFDDASVYRLSTNYRSRPQIIDLANSIARKVTLRDPDKVMKPGRSATESRVVHWISLGTEYEQASACLDIVEKFAAKGIPWNKMAVLLRSVVGSGKPIVDALKSRGIPVQCPILSRGGEFISEFLLPVLNWLRSEHEEPRNEIEEALAEDKANELWNSVHNWLADDNAEHVFWGAINDWLDAIEQSRNEAYDVRGCLYELLNACGIGISSKDYSLTVGLGIASQIIRSVEEIQRRRLLGRGRRSPHGVMSEVYFALLRKQQDFGESVPIDTTTDGVVVTTVHQAKGLEWPVVIIPMVVNRRFPVRSRNHGTSFPDELAGRYGTSLEDERRLFYVAVTRAKERLFLLDPAKSSITHESVFLGDLRSDGIIEAIGIDDIDDSEWAISPKDLEESDPPPFRIGLSDLLLYVECPFQFGLRRTAAVQPSVGDELGFGKGLHELIQRRFDSGHDWEPQELKRNVSQYVSLPYMSEEGERHAQNIIEGRLRGLEDLGLFTAETESEASIEVLIDGAIIKGIIDGIQVDGSDRYRIMDWKSNIHDSFMPRYERQVQFYAYALRLQGKTISNAQIVDVAASTQQKTLVARTVDISPKAIDELLETLKGSIKGIAAGRFQATPNELSCGCCDMYKICSERWTNVIVS